MKTVLQKRSKFVSGLLQSLCLSACISQVSCGNKENQNEKERKQKFLVALEQNGFYNSEALDIIQYCDERGIEDITTWAQNKKNLHDLFNSDLVWNRLHHTEFENTIEEERINAWQIRLKKFTNFQRLGKDKQQQVIELLIKENVDIIFPDNKIEKRLKDFIDQIDKEDKDMIPVTFCTGTATIYDKEYNLNTFEGLKTFIEEVKGKKINRTGNFSYEFVADNKIKICGGNEIDLPDFNSFLGILNSLVEVEGLNVQSIDLQILDDGVKLNKVKCSDEYYKGDFWTVVKDYNALFGILDKKLPIEKIGNDDDAHIKIKGKLVSNLKWENVVDKENNIIKDEWNKIFILKEKVTIKFCDNGNYKIAKDDQIDNAQAFGLNNFEDIENLIEDLDFKTITDVVGDLKIDFENDGKVKIGKNNTKTFVAVDKNNFERLLFDLEALTKCIPKFNPQITLTVDDKNVMLDNKNVDDNFAKSEAFWTSIKKHVALFKDLNNTKLQISKATDEAKVKIKDFETELSIKTVCQDLDVTPVVFNDSWDKIFTKN